MSKTALLQYDGQEYQLPIVRGTENEQALDISKLRAQSNLVTLDRGYKNTGSTTSAITFLDGENGVLRYRGYDINELASKSTFLETAYLLINGELPTQTELDYFAEEITQHTLAHEDIKKILDGFPSNSHPMGILSSLVCSLTAFYPESLDPHRSQQKVNTSILRILAKMPTFAAWAYKKEKGFPIIYPNNNLDYCSNFLYMMFGLPTEQYEVKSNCTQCHRQIAHLACRPRTKLLHFHSTHCWILTSKLICLYIRRYQRLMGSPPWGC